MKVTHTLSIVAWMLLPLCAVAFQYEEYSFLRAELELYKNQTKELFYWSLDQYFEHAYPYDELDPVECMPHARNFEDPLDTARNDVLGNFSLTLIDSLTTLIVFDDVQNFTKIVGLFSETVDADWDIDSTVQAFEPTIRIIGSFLSAHIYITDKGFWDTTSEKYPSYDSIEHNLLYRAARLADIILETYKTPSKLPLPRVNLRHGVAKIAQEHPELLQSNNPVAMSCPFFEFHLLSILTGDDKYRVVSRFAYDKVIEELTSELGLIPHSVDPVSLKTFDAYTNVGASIDSVYEYSLKSAVLFNEEETLNIYNELVKSINVYSENTWFYKTVDVHNGATIADWVDSLSAFFPGLLVLNGDVESATYKNQFYWKLWNYFGGIPERWDFAGKANQRVFGNPEIMSNESEKRKELLNGIIPLEWYPLRPEMIESSWYLYQATRDPMYLNIGKQVLHDLRTRFKCKCGLCGIQNIKTGEMQKRLESFVFSETLQYLYLLFDHDSNPRKYNDVIFNTEAHPFYVPRKRYKEYLHNRFFNDTYFSHIQEYKNLWETSLKSNVFTNEGGNTTCPIYENLMSSIPSNEKSTFMYSPLLNDSLHLFEFDREYHQKLIYPEWLIQERGNNENFHMEIIPEFLDKYNHGSDKPATCRLSKVSLAMGDTYTSDFKTREDRLQPGYATHALVGSSRQYSLEANHIGPNTFKSIFGCNIKYMQGYNIKGNLADNDDLIHFYLLKVDDQTFDPDEKIYFEKKSMFFTDNVPYDVDRYDENSKYVRKLKQKHGNWKLSDLIDELKGMQTVISMDENNRLILGNVVLLENVYLI